MTIIRIKHAQEGSALLMTILVLSSLMVVGLSAASVALSGSLISGVQQRSTVALYVAETGAEAALYEARKNSWVLPVASSSVNVFNGVLSGGDGGSYTVDYASTTDAVTGSTTSTFYSDGDYKETRRRIELQF